MTVVAPMEDRVVDISVVGDANAFATLKDEWDALVTRSPRSTLFGTWQWLYSWWEVFGQGLDLHIVIARDSNGGMLGIAPLFKREIAGVRGAVELRFIGCHSVGSQYLDFLIAGGHEEAVTAAILDHLCVRGRCLLFHLFRLPADSPTLIGLSRTFKTGRAGCREEVSYHLPLGSDWETYLSSLNASVRHNIRRFRRKWAALGTEIVEWRSADEGVLADVERLHQGRMGEKGHLGSFSSSRFRQFYRQASERTAERGWYRTYALTVEGSPAAVVSGFAFGGKYYDYVHGFDPARRSLSPGVAAVSYAVEQSMQAGLVEFDFLGAGDYKEHWRAVPRRVLSFTVSSRPVILAVWALGVKGRAASAAVLRQVVPGRLHHQLRRLRQRVLIAFGRPLR
jgi:CelD/BcsL family acetyltransferase involved in cellulose biosynthesis